MNQLLYNEFITSTNFPLLFKQALSLFNPNFGLGFYLQGIPTRPGVDFFWGTSSGIRTLPLLIWLNSLKISFGNNWELMYLLTCIIAIPICFILGNTLVKKLDIWIILGALFYTLNPWVVTKIFTGTWQQILAYALLPLALFIPDVINKQNYIKSACLFSLLVSIIIIFNPIYLLFPGAYLLLKFFGPVFNKTYIKTELVYFYTLSIILIVLLNTYYLVPSILYPEYQTTFYPGYSLGAIRYNSQNSYLQNVLRLDVWSNMQNIRWNLVNFIQTVPLIFIFIIFIKNKKRNWLLLSCLLIFIFLTKALHPPGTNISKWLFENITILKYSRDTSRFLAAVILFGSLIISSYCSKSILKISKQVTFVFISLIVMWLSVQQFFANTSINLLYKTEIPTEYANLEQFIGQNLKLEDRILTIPNNLAISSYQWYEEKTPPSPKTLFAGILPLKTPIIDSSYYPDNYSNQISAFLYNKYLTSKNAAYLRPLGVKYVLFDWNLPFDQNIPIETSKLLFNSGHLQLVDIFPNHITRLKDTKTPTFVIGDLNSIAKRFEKEQSYPVILLNQPHNIDLLLNGTLNNINIESDVDNPALALTGENLSKSYSVDLFEYSKNQDKVFIPYEPYNLKVIEKYGVLFTNPKPVVSNGLGTLDVFHKLSPGKYKILIKGILLGQQSHLTLKIDTVVRDIYLNNIDSLIWSDLGTVDINFPTDSINISSLTPDLVGIDYLLIVPESIFDTKIHDIENILGKNTTNKNSNTYLNYLVSFGKYWSANNSQFKLISNGYAMTFVSNSQNIGTPVYYPELSYNISLFISSSTFVIITLYLIISFLIKLRLSLTAKFHLKRFE